MLAKSRGMTIVREDDVDLEPVHADPEPEVDEEESDRRERPSKWRWQRIVAIALVVGLAVFLVFQLFTGPVERLWYRNRQSQLASDLTTPHRAHPRRPGAWRCSRSRGSGSTSSSAEGDSPERLRSGPGHRMGTPLPGRRGNSVVFGHRDAWGGPFSSLTKVERSDFIVVQNKA